MLKVGLTGGIGSGKSLVARIFSSLGEPVYHADERAKVLMKEDAELARSLRRTFGEHIYRAGELDRKALAAMVFPDEEKLAQLNALVHPVVARDFRDWCVDHEYAPYVVEEAAILIENGAHEHLDRIVLVTAPEHLRIERVMERDGSSEQEIRERMERQWTDEDKLPYADEVIQNDGEHSVLEEVLRIHKALRG